MPVFGVVDFLRYNAFDDGSADGKGVAAQVGACLGIQFQTGTCMQKTPSATGDGRRTNAQEGWTRSAWLLCVLDVQVLGLQLEVEKADFPHPEGRQCSPRSRVYS